TSLRLSAELPAHGLAAPPVLNIAAVSQAMIGLRRIPNRLRPQACLDLMYEPQSLRVRCCWIRARLRHRLLSSRELFLRMQCHTSSLPRASAANSSCAPRRLPPASDIPHMGSWSRM